MLKCPDCGRKLPAEAASLGSFQVGPHLNYTKTAPCPGSGGRFVAANPPPPPVSPRLLALLGISWARNEKAYRYLGSR